MSQLRIPPRTDSQRLPAATAYAHDPVGDSPTIPGLPLVVAAANKNDGSPGAGGGGGAASPQQPPPLTIPNTPRSLRKAAPSPLQTSTAVSPPSTSKSPGGRTDVSPLATCHELDHDHDSSAPAAAPSSSFSGLNNCSGKQQPRPSSQPVSGVSPSSSFDNSSAAGRSFFTDDVSPPVSPLSTTGFTDTGSIPVRFTPPNEPTTTPDPTAAVKPAAGLPNPRSPTMSGLAKSESSQGMPRNSSIDSAISSIASRVRTHGSVSHDSSAPSEDIASLISSVGSPEALIHHLLKDKHSQTQQNAQLWRLVDKQRAMILGLNKDLERALKDKERYRKKLKEVMAAHDPDSSQLTASLSQSTQISDSREATPDGPASPSNVDSDSAKNSPIDISIASFPLTPPADQLVHRQPSIASGLLESPRVVPSAEQTSDIRPQTAKRVAHVADDARTAGTPSPRDLSFNLSLPPSRSLPNSPPKMPLPQPPTSVPAGLEAAPLPEPSLSQFSPPSAPPPRKPPPAPLQLNKDPMTSPKSSPLPPEDEAENDNDSESDYDSLLGVDEMPPDDRRGRRRTREEDDQIRVDLAHKEAEARSLSKHDDSETPKAEVDPAVPELPASPRAFGLQPGLARDNVPTSLAGVLNGDSLSAQTLTAPLKSPGLPASPRPLHAVSPLNSPPLSPRSVGANAAPLSPRAPRQPIPLPPSTPLATPLPSELSMMGSPTKSSMHTAKSSEERGQPGSPASRASPTDRKKVYKGYVTEDYSDLLLPPNALPSIAVKVASSRMKPSRASLMSLTQLEEDPVFTLAIFSRAERRELWRVEKDIASFGKLDQRMKQCAAFTARTPDRSIFSGHAPAKLDARRTVLDQYLEELLNTPLDVPTALDFCKYLSTNTLPPNGDEIAPADQASDLGPQRTGAGGRPLRSGYLTKRGKNFGGWKARFFVLDGPQLKYFEAPGGAHLGTIKLQGAQIGKQSQHSNEGASAGASNDDLDHQYRHAFLIMEPKKKDSSSHVKHVLCAESDQERDYWVKTLLRWIDYRESDEDAHPGAGPSRVPPQTSNGPAVVRKNPPAKSKAHSAHSNSQDGLIGMSYDAAKPGDQPRTESPNAQDRAPAPSYTISAPRDPQVISDSASWGSKAALAPPGPTVEEKKQRKRSFFGFGPKTRSASDDQDSTHASGGASTPPFNERNATGRGPVFGLHLGEAVKYHSPVDVSVPLPAVVYRCIQYLDAKDAILEEGIFRLSGSNLVIRQLRERFNNESDINLITDETFYDIHAVASLLKLYLRELPTTILTPELHNQFVAVTEMAHSQEKLGALGELVKRLPQANSTILMYLISFLIKINNNADMNKMTARNVGIVFSPTLNIPAPVFALLLNNYEAVFHIKPEEYELPSPVSETDSRPPTELQHRRPSASGAADSPQRQKLMEQIRQRGSPTQGMAGTIRHVHQESLQQQAAAYEGGFTTAGYEPSTSQQSPGYMQPVFENPNYGAPSEPEYGDSSFASDNTFTSRAKKRESSMFMMGLNHQNSKSRLRDETKI